MKRHIIGLLATVAVVAAIAAATASTASATAWSCTFDSPTIAVSSSNIDVTGTAHCQGGTGLGYDSVVILHPYGGPLSPQACCAGPAALWYDNSNPTVLTNEAILPYNSCDPGLTKWAPNSQHFLNLSWKPAPASCGTNTSSGRYFAPFPVAWNTGQSLPTPLCQYGWNAQVDLNDYFQQSNTSVFNFHVDPTC